MSSRRARPLSRTFPTTCEAYDIAAPYVAPKLIADRPDVIFLLASVVSGEAESDFDKGYAVNLDGARMLFEAIRREQRLSGGAYRPQTRLHLVDRSVRRAVPRNYRRRFLLDAADELRNAESDLRIAARRLFASRLFRRGRLAAADDLRAPRPAQRAASGFFSGIIREPLAGREACCRSPKPSSTGTLRRARQWAFSSMRRRRPRPSSARGAI